MSKQVRDHLRSNVVGYVALFLALSMGTAYATHPGGANTISSEDIINKEIRTADIRDNNVQTANLGPSAVTSPKIADGAVQSSDVADDTLTGADVNESTLSGLWTLAGNSGTNPASDFLGTTDNQPLNLRVNNARALRLEPASDGFNESPNVIGGSADNSVSAGVFSATIAGGGRGLPFNPATANRVTDSFGTVGGGANNQAGDNAGAVGDRRFATVGGGDNNTASEAAATVAGGVRNTASGNEAFVGGGDNNTASDGDATVAGGNDNIASEVNATVGGGEGNEASGGSAFVGGGVGNTASGGDATVGGGDVNTADGDQATVGGGELNTASGLGATVPGGVFNTAAGDYSLVAGQQAQNTDATHDGVFLFGDSTNAAFASAAANEFAVRATGGFRFRTNSALSTGCNLPAGSGTFSCTSDREAKSGFASVSPGEVLAGLSRLPIESWVYKSDPAQVRHIGPTSQAFKRAFGIGEDPRTISSVDADGVALAAIKGLNERVEALSAKAGPAAPVADASGLAPAAAAGIALVAALLAATLGAVMALRLSGRAGGGLATG